MKASVNFHMTFPPTPAYIGRLLKIADGKMRTSAEIADLTGIPEGNSSGKVRPHIAYAAYMGLIDADTFTCTALGDKVKEEDCMIAEKLTQLICHVRLCSESGAELWNFMFRKLLPENQGKIGMEALAEAMQRKFGASVKYAPIISMYTKQFTKLNLLQVDVNAISVCSLSVEKDMLYVYAYALLYEWELVFPEKMEITEGELNQLQFAACFGWNRQTENDVLQLLVDRNIIGVNRQLVPFTVQKLTCAQSMIPKLYSMLL